MKTKIHDDSDINPFGTVQVGINKIAFKEGKCILNDKGTITVDSGLKMVAFFLDDVNILNEKVVVTIGGVNESKRGFDFYEPRLFKLFCQSMMLPE